MRHSLDRKYFSDKFVAFTIFLGLLFMSGMFLINTEFKYVWMCTFFGLWAVWVNIYYKTNLEKEEKNVRQQ